MASVRSKVEYVIFDMDGLIIDSESVYTRVTNDILAEYGKEMTWDIKAGLMGKPEKEAALHLLSFFPDISLTIEDYLRRRDEAQDKAWPTVPLLPGIEKLVHHLKKHGIPMAVATGSRKRNYILKTKSAQVQPVFQYFDLEKNVVTGDPLPEDPDTPGRVANGQRGIRKGRGKPNPDIFLVTAKECLGIDIGDVSTDVSVDLAEGLAVERRKGLVFEDAIPGVIAAKRAGMNVVWVAVPELRALEAGADIAADQIIQSLEEFRPEEWGLPPYDS